MIAKNRKHVFNLLRIVICIGALWYVVRGVTVDDHITLTDDSTIAGRVIDDADPIVVLLTSGEQTSIARDQVAVNEQGNLRISYGLRTAWYASNKWLLLLALAIYFPVVFLQSLRIQWLLKAQEIKIGFLDAVRFSFAGNFLNFAAPLGSNAGDVFKAYFLSLHTNRKTEAIATVLYDRVVGLASLLFVVAMITLFSPADTRLAEFRPYMLSMLGGGIGLTIVYFAPPVRKYLLPQSLLHRIPMIDHIRRADAAAHALLKHKGLVVSAVMVTILLQAIAVAAYFTIAISLAFDARIGNFLEYYTYFCTGVVIQALPGPPQGLGTVELAYSYFFKTFGSASQIICLAFAIRLLVLVAALPGLWVTMTGSYKPQASIDLPQEKPTTDTSKTKADLASV